MSISITRSTVAWPRSAAGLLVLSVLGVGACSSGSLQESAVPAAQSAGPSTLTEPEVIAIARQAVSQNESWVERAEFEAPQRTSEGWSVLVWRLPKAPGGHCLVQIDATGQVTRYVRGR